MGGGEDPIKQVALIQDKVQFEDTWHFKSIVLCLALENVGGHLGSLKVIKGTVIPRHLSWNWNPEEMSLGTFYALVFLVIYYHCIPHAAKVCRTQRLGENGPSRCRGSMHDTHNGVCSTPRVSCRLVQARWLSLWTDQRLTWVPSPTLPPADRWQW